jgi:4-carboxymuconolactone decarboxylase
MTAPAVPIDAATLSRLPPIAEESLSQDAKALKDTVLSAHPPLIAGLRGPTGIWMHRPRIGLHLYQVNRELLQDTALELPLRELAILVTAKEMASEFEWGAHEPLARKAGLAEAAIACVAEGGPTDTLPPEAAAVIDLGRDVFRRGKVADATYGRCLEVLGQQRLFTTAAVFSFFALTAVMLGVFDQRSPATMPSA